MSAWGDNTCGEDHEKIKSVAFLDTALLRLSGRAGFFAQANVSSSPFIILNLQSKKCGNITIIVNQHLPSPPARECKVWCSITLNAKQKSFEKVNALWLMVTEFKMMSNTTLLASVLEDIINSSSYVNLNLHLLII